MSVRTTSDEKLDEAAEHLKKAWRLMIEAIDPGTYGSNEFRPDYIEQVNQDSSTVFQVYKRLNR